MKKYLMKIKVNMLIVLIISLLGGMVGSYFFNNRWLGLIVAVPLCALYIYQVYQVQADYREQHTKKNQILGDYAKGNNIVHQLIDLALLQNGMLTGEALSNFVKRSIYLIQ